MRGLKKRGQNVIREVGGNEGGAVCHSLTSDDAIHQHKDKVQANKQTVYWQIKMLFFSSSENIFPVSGEYNIKVV